MSNVKDLTGKKYHKLTVLRRVGTKNKRSYWECLCECGNKKLLRSNQFTHGNAKSCGCLKLELLKARTITHGESGSNETTEHRIWAAMLRRCSNKNCKPYYRYGGRGIKVCDRWQSSYENFLIDMGRRPSRKHTLERIENNGNYEPSNCKWATYKEQGNNTRVNQCVTFNGETKTLMQWSEYLNLPYKALWSRLFSAHWSTEKAFSQPIRNWKN